MVPRKVNKGFSRNEMMLDIVSWRGECILYVVLEE